MTGLKNLILAFTVLGASTAAFASDDNFASLSLGQTRDKVKKSHTLGERLNYSSADSGVDKNSTWGARLAQPNTQGHYYATYNKVAGTLNGIKLRQEDLLGKYPIDTLGGSLRISSGLSAELGYRYPSSNARSELSANYAC
ncbi:hypothetical protein [Pseudomonas sp. NFX15]|uniref:hypothetical protein n=1 Tax=Pseudomonas sp. NFX15 TaxID=2816958 RepID=UPI003B8C2F77